MSKTISLCSCDKGKISTMLTRSTYLSCLTASFQPESSFTSTKLELLDLYEDQQRSRHEAQPEHENRVSPAKRSRKAFPFLQLPGELRNMVYSFASEEAEADAVMPIIKKPQAKETKQIENKSFALLRVSKQVRAEYYHYIHGAVHGTIYWSRHHGYMQARCPWGLAFKRTKTAMQISRTLQDYGQMFQLVRHLDLHGSGAAALVLDLVDYDEEKLDGSNICEERADRKRVFLRDLRLVMQNLESITMYADESQTALLRKQATGWECRLEMLTVFPKLKTIRMQNGTCVEVLVQRNHGENDGNKVLGPVCPPTI